MGMDLMGAAGDFRFSSLCWVKLLELAHLYGWAPSGTTLPGFEHEGLGYLELAAGEVWDGHYDSNDGQVVSASDAAALAAALERALDDLPNHHACVVGVHEAGRPPADIGISEFVAQVIREAMPGARCVSYGPDPQASPIAFWSGAEMKDKVTAFIGYCQQGSFRIW